MNDQLTLLYSIEQLFSLVQNDKLKKTCIPMIREAKACLGSVRLTDDEHRELVNGSFIKVIREYRYRTGKGLNECRDDLMEYRKIHGINADQI